MTKHRLVIEVECGKLTCGDCDWHKGDGEDGECAMFEMYLVDGIMRDPKCLEAEAKADEMMLKTAMAKAAPQTI